MTTKNECQKIGDCEVVKNLTNQLEEAVRLLRTIRAQADMVSPAMCRIVVPAGTSLDRSMTEIKRLLVQCRIDQEVKLPDD